MAEEPRDLVLSDNVELIQYLQESRLFGHLPQDTIEQLLPLSKLVNLNKGTEILTEGQINSRVFFLLRGTVEISSEGEQILRLHRKGDIFGEMSIISSKPCTATVIAKTDVTVFSIRAADVGEYTDMDNDSLHNTFYRLFAAILTEKLALTTHKAQQYEATNRLLKEAKEELQRAHNELEMHKEALFDEKERLSVTLQCIGDGIITTDTEYNVVMLNRVAEILTGWTQQEAFGKQLSEVFRLVNARTREVIPNLEEKIFPSTQISGLTKHSMLTSKIGEEHIISSNVSPIKDSSGHNIGGVIVFHDIFQRRSF